MDGLDARELDSYVKDLLNLASKTMPKETANFLRKEGNKLRRRTVSKAKTLVGKDSGKYLRSIKRGKVYKFQSETQAVRVYASKQEYKEKEMPTAHIIEYGHRIVDRFKREHGFQAGKHVFRKAGTEFEHEFVKDCEQFIDDMLDKGLR